MRWVIWAFAALFYFYEYLLRVSPSTMVPELMQTFNLNAAQIGVLGSSFFWTYAPMQLPVGVLMDRFGARKLISIASIGTAIGALFFGLAKAVSLAYIGRILIGAGASFGFVAMVFVCTHWFEMSKRALLVGLANSIAMLGGLAGEGPLADLVHAVGWRWSMMILAIAGFVLGFLILLTLFKKDPPAKDMDERVKTHENTHNLLSGMKIFFTSGQSWLISFSAVFFYVVTSAMTGLWGIPFIQTAYNVSKSTAGYAISMIFLGWLVGGPLTGAISDKLKNRKKVIIISILLTILCFTPIIYWTSMPIGLLYVLIFFTGLFSSAELLNFTCAAEINPSQMKGVSIACTNFIVAVGSGFIMPLIGILLDKAAKISPQSGYTAQDYRAALTVLPICLVIAWILTLFINEKHRQAQS